MIKDLYAKVAQFEQQLGPLAKLKSQCKNGCSKCCYTDISVFEVEASNIKAWFSALSQEEQKKIQAKWELPRTEGSCIFLRNESCSIYEARPLICRTQGLALKFMAHEEVSIDICPLNEEMLDVMEDKEVMNLDLLNTILSQIERADSPDEIRERIKLSDLQALLK
jgi:uncharacterized protein